MPEEPALRDYQSEPTRVRVGSGKPWLAVWGAVAVAVVAIGVAGTVMAPKSDSPTPGVAGEAAAAAVPAPPAIPAQPAIPAPPATPATPVTSGTVAALPPIDITSGASGYAAAFDSRRRRSTPLIVESTDFHANSGAAYYGIGGKLIRALAPVPTRTPNPGDAPD